MPKRTRNKRSEQVHSRPRKAVKKVSCTALVPLDTRKIVSAYRTRCLKIKKDFEKAKKTLELHEKEELPSFLRWLRNQTGPLVSEFKSMEEEIREKQFLLNELSYRWKIGRWKSKYECYVSYLEQLEKKKKQGDGSEENSYKSDNDFDFDDEFDDDDFDDEDFDEDDFDDDEDFDDGFDNDFDDEDFDGGGYERFGKDSNEFRKFINRLLGISSDELEDDEYAVEKERKIKDLYRVICRKLHPDTGVDFDDKISGLWHETQEAYQKRDIDRLEAILALCEMNCPEGSKKLACSQIITVIRHYEDGKRSVSSLLRKAKKSESWGFLSWNEDRKQRVLGRNMSLLKTDLAERKYWLEMLKRKLDQWITAPVPAPEKNVKRPFVKKVMSHSDQMSFEF